jgi:hypothetical protein
LLGPSLTGSENSLPSIEYFAFAILFAVGPTVDPRKQSFPKYAFGSS